MMKTRGVVLLIICAAGWVFAGVADQTARCPGADDGSETWERYSVKRGLDYSAADSVVIWNYLESLDAGIEERASIKNNLLDRLVEQDPIPSDLGARLLRLYRERALNVRMRDYTLQHFAPFIMGVARHRNWKNDHDVQAMIGELQGALWNGEGTMDGTALLALESLAPLGEMITVSDVGVYAVNLASDEKRSAAVRSTAIQVATRLGCREILGSARTAIQADQPLSLRLAAVASLGALGEVSDKDGLKRLQEEDSSAHVRLAARRVLDQRSRVDVTAKPKTISADSLTIRKGDKI